MTIIENLETKMRMLHGAEQKLKGDQLTERTNKMTLQSELRGTPGETRH